MVDGSFKQENGSAGTRMVLRDDAGAVIFSACRSLPSCEEALEAKLIARTEGLELAIFLFIFLKRRQKLCYSV
jgi:hypothetical protein